MIARPYSLITSRSNPAMLRAPDLSKWTFNRLFGMGDPEHNRKLREAREAARPVRDANAKIELWGIWNLFRGAAKVSKPNRFPKDDD